MRRLTETDGLTDLQRDILAAVREFVDAEIIPVASELDHSDTYPDGIVAGLRELGVFGLTIDQKYGGLGESLLTYALVAEEIAQLSEADLQPAQYYTEFLQRLYFAMQSFAAAIWIRTPQGNLLMQCQMQLREVGLDRTPESRPTINELLYRPVEGLPISMRAFTLS